MSHVSLYIFLLENDNISQFDYLTELILQKQSPVLVYNLTLRLV